MHSKHKPVGCFDFKLQREQEGKYFSKPKSCQKDIELDQSGQTKKQNTNISVGKEEEKLPIVVFLCRKP